MDRRHRPILSGQWLAGCGAAALLLSVGSNLPAQETPSASTPAASATPWVQASPPPGFVATPPPAATVTPTPTPVPPKPKPPKPLGTPKPSASPAAMATPTPSLAPEDVAREMMRRRIEEKRESRDERKDRKDEKKDAKDAVRLDQVPPDERAAYQRNLPLWKQLPPEERQDLRRQADERARQEIDKAYQDSGLNLDPDQREVFALRYRQERRKLERELQERINLERTRRLTEIGDRLKREFAGRAQGGAPATASPAPSLKPEPPTPRSAPNPDTLTRPGPGFLR